MPDNEQFDLDEIMDDGVGADFDFDGGASMDGDLGEEANHVADGFEAPSQGFKKYEAQPVAVPSLFSPHAFKK